MSDLSLYYLICAATFFATYALNMTYISVFYHRGFTHQAISMPPAVRSFIIATGNWVTGIDLKSWACMHRMHHMYSDTEKDPHSPRRWGLFGTLYGQYHSYQVTTRALLRNREEYTKFVTDLDFPVNSLNKKALWYLPYILHLVVSLVLGFGFGWYLLGFSWFLGMMSHPIQGWLVNAFAHSKGYRNFNTTDDSTNNTFVALTCFGEGFQNNHHRFPKSAKFSMKWFEFDFGWMITLLLERLGVLEIKSVTRLTAKQNDLAPDAAEPVW
jgi:stearoyl-CoA desaturase (Delta-9 desaturase)